MFLQMFILNRIGKVIFEYFVHRIPDYNMILPTVLNYASLFPLLLILPMKWGLPVSFVLALPLEIHPISNCLYLKTNFKKFNKWVRLVS